MSDTRQEKITRGREAAELLGDDEYTGAWDLAAARVRDRLYTQWQSAESADDPKAKAAWAQTKALDLIEEELRRIVAEGQFEQEALRRTQ